MVAKAKCPLCENSVMWYSQIVCARCWNATDELMPGEYYLTPREIVNLTIEDVERLELLRDDRVERYDLEREKRSLRQTVRDHETRLDYITEVGETCLRELSVLANRADEAGLTWVMQRAEELLANLTSLWLVSIVEEDEEDLLLTEGPEAMSELSERMARTIRNFLGEKRA